ncbi:MAG: AAA family ATPase [Alphaproteobacteria bacterium]|nr:AAA family ATPase [Alphaproteobacteria bacterium]
MVGANEAGKSTAMAAIQDLLFGFFTWVMGGSSSALP